MNKLLLLAIVWLTACIIEEPSPLGRVCDPKVVCGPGAVCRDKVCVLADAKPDGGPPDLRPPDGTSIDASGQAPDGT